MSDGSHARSLSAEVQAAGEAHEEGEYVRLVLVGLRFWTARYCLMVSLRASQVSDKRSALEAMALNISLYSTKTHPHWVHSEAQLADVMT